MKSRERMIVITLCTAAAIAIAGGLCVPGRLRAQTAPTIETVVTLPAEPNGRTENISEGPDGAIYVTAPLDHIVWKVKNGKAEKFFSSPNVGSIAGVAGTDDDLLILVAAHSPFQRPDGQVGRNPNPQDPESQGILLDKSGKVKLAVANPDPKNFLNGLARAGDGWYLATNAIGGGGVISIDMKAKTIQSWFQDPMIRTNGIKVHNGWVYLTSGDKVYRVQIGPDKKPMGGAMVFATAGQTDDFAVAPDGTLYIPSGKTMLKVTPSGQTSVFLSDIGDENPAAAWVTRDGKWLYWPERLGPAKLKRVALK
jgi:hypothetical protein